MTDRDSHPKPWAPYLCEFWGTFCLVLIGTGAIVINDLTQQVTHVGVSLCFGLVVFVVIYSIGSVSGAHINPAVSIGFFATREIGLCADAPHTERLTTRRKSGQKRN